MPNPIIERAARAIPWRPIDELPDELKDGRQVLLWADDGADVGTWTSGENDWDKPESGYFEALYECVPCADPTHFAEIVGP